MKLRSLVLAALVAGPLLAAAGFKARGFSLPDGAVRIEDDRYRLLQTWEEAAKWYRTVYPPAKFPRRTLHNEAGVRAVHIANPGGAEWDGANLYETRGEVRVYVLAGKSADDEDAKPAKKAKGK